MGLGIGFIWLLVHHYYEKGLPPRSVVYTSIASLAIMPIFGFHLLDPGPQWRLWSGVIFGNAVALLILPATSVIRSNGKPLDIYTGFSTLSFFVMYILLNITPLWFPIQSACFYYAVLTVVLTGLLSVLFCIISIITHFAEINVISSILEGYRDEYSKS